MSFTTHTGDEKRAFAYSPSLLAMSIAFALAPVASFAATTATEDTVVVEGNGLQTEVTQD
jgi:outer membrane receptor for ferric coprogen and ferric-rhodotorulic acid